MTSWGDILILIGMSSLGLLWGFAALGAIGSLWDTFGTHLTNLIAKAKR